MTSGARRQWLADGAFGLAVAAVGLTVAAAVAGPLSWDQLVAGGVRSNTGLGFALALCGYPIARTRTRNAVGWVLLGSGLAFEASGAGYAALGWIGPSREVGPKLLADLTNIGWPLSIGVLLPLVLLLFPDGLLLSRSWRWVAALTGLNGLAFVAMLSLGDEPTTHALRAPHYLRLAGIEDQGWLGPATGLLGGACYLAGVGALVVRYRRGGDRQRPQVLWLLLGAMLMVGGFIVTDVLNAPDWAGSLPVLPLPVAVVIAVLRHQLLDIRVVVARSVLYVSLTAVVVGSFVALVVLMGALLNDRVPLGPPVLATIAVALGVNPVRLWLQRSVTRLFYGPGRDPVRALSEVGARMGEFGAADATGLSELLAGLCSVLRLPYAAIRAGGLELAAHGDAVGTSQALPLRLGGVDVGELVVGVRSGERQLSTPDQRVLALVSHSVAVAVHSVSLAADLRTARTALVSTREEERRRLRRELHDGVGPVLTGVVLKADAARRVAVKDPVAAAAMMEDARLQTTAAIDEIRRLSRDLRPPAIDGLGLVGALREHTAGLAPLCADVRIDGTLPELPAAVEVAVYRIATEALTNVVRHTSATTAIVALGYRSGELSLLVEDNGGPHEHWTAGVGLTSMAERAAELGGRLESGPGEGGGRVALLVPVPGSAP